MAKQISINLNISNDPTMEAFGAYVAGSIEKGTAKVVMNVEATLTACAEHDIEFKDIIAETTLHELLHAIQELYGRAFDEAEVEDAIERLRNYVAVQKMGEAYACGDCGALVKEDCCCNPKDDITED